MAQGLRLNKGILKEAGTCLRLAWFRVRDREKAEPKQSAADLLRKRWGLGVGELARRQFPDGILIDEPNFGAALAETQKALASGHGVLFEAAFAWDGMAMRADVLRRREDGYDLIEVKAGVLAADYYEDVAVQVIVLEGLGFSVRPFLMLLDRSATLESPSLFKLVDCAEEVRKIAPGIRARISAIKAAARSPEPLSVKYTRKCRDCPYLSECLPDLPEQSILTLHRGGVLIDEMLARSVQALADVPDDAKLTECQLRQVEAARTGQLWVSPTLADALAVVSFPMYFLDFEACRFPLPQYADTRPYDLVPFQWSCHVLGHENAAPVHRDFLWEGAGDPRRPCAVALLDAVGQSGSIVVYTNFEAQVIRALADALPDLREQLLALVPRLVDLHAIVKDHIYHPAFKGSYSIKSVLPALVPNMNYDGMQVRDGMGAVLAWLELRDPETPLVRRSEIAADLRAYCRLDSLAMAEVWRALRSLRARKQRLRGLPSKR